MHLARFFALLVGLCFAMSAAHAQLSPVSMRVEQVSKPENDKWKHTQNKGMKITLTNSSSQDKAGLIVKYYFFGKSVKDNDVIVLDKGEKTADVKARNTEVIDTPKLSRTYIEEHYESGKGGNKGGGKAGKKVEESGEKIVGYGAQLFEGTKLLTEFYSQASYKALVGPRPPAK